MILNKLFVIGILIVVSYSAEARDTTTVKYNFFASANIGKNEFLNNSLGLRIYDQIYIFAEYGFTNANDNVHGLYLWDEFAKGGLLYRYKLENFSPDVIVDYERVIFRGEPTAKDGFTSISYKNSFIGSLPVGINYNLCSDNKAALDLFLRSGIRYSNILDQGNKYSFAFQFGGQLMFL